MKSLHPLWLCAAIACLPADLSLAPECNGSSDCHAGMTCHQGVCLQPFRSCNSDGVLDPGEACDDGDIDDGNACTTDCRLARCGDGIKRTDLAMGMPGYEACDDGNDHNLDACTNACVQAVCGDSLLRADLALGEPEYEACDDGNLINGDGCNEHCVVNRCGDGILWAAHEACDDGNSDETDACTNNCQPARCGDGITRRDRLEGEDGYEACDDGGIITASCLDDCTLARCGDGVLRLGLAPDDEDFEACDDGNIYDDDACLTNCELARCGDGILRNDLPLSDPAYEACDDGNDEALDDCNPNCAKPHCGDGIIDPRNELCDDGNNDNGDECSANCGRNVVRIHPGFDHTCALTENGYAYCVGASSFLSSARYQWLLNNAIPEWSQYSSNLQASFTPMQSEAIFEKDVNLRWPMLSTDGQPGQGGLTDLCSAIMTCFVRGHGQVARQGLFCDARNDLGCGRLTRLHSSPHWRGLTCQSNAQCALDDQGRVFCWRGQRSNPIGQAGDAPAIRQLPVCQLGRPQPHPDGGGPIINARDVVITGDAICVHLQDGSVTCNGQWLGSGPDDRFEQVVGLARLACARRQDHSITCHASGTNFDPCEADNCAWSGGELSVLYPKRSPDEYLMDAPIFQFRQAGHHSSDLWGLNEGFGQVAWRADDRFSELPPNTKYQILPQRIAALEIGRISACAITTSGRGICFGMNGLLGSQCMMSGWDGVARSSRTTLFSTRRPVARVYLGPETGKCSRSVGCISTLRTVVVDRFGRAMRLGVDEPAWERLGPISDVALGLNHACVLRRNGRVLCNGLNQSGELGVSGQNLTHRVDFQIVEGVPAMARLAVQNELTCGSTADGELWCWGRLGRQQNQAPRRIDLPASVRHWSMAENDEDEHQTKPICAVLSDHSIWCLQTENGAPWNRVLGQANAQGWRPLAPPSDQPITDLIASSSDLCTLSGTEGQVHCLTDQGFAPVTTGDETNVQLLAGNHRRTQDGRLFNGQEAFAENVVDASANRKTLCFANAEGELHCKGRLSALLVGDNQCSDYFVTGW